MLRSGKELKVFTVKSGDLKKFMQDLKKIYEVVNLKTANTRQLKYLLKTVTVDS